MSPPHPHVPTPADPLAPDRRLLAVERAIDALKRGRPVAVVGESSTILVVAAETLDAPTLAALHAAGPADLVLTRHRAKVLRLLDAVEEAVTLALPPDMDAAAVAALGDPTEDLARPLRGPFATRTDADPDPRGAALTLAKLGQMLPAVVAVAVTDRAWADGRNLPVVAAADVRDHAPRAGAALRAPIRAAVQLAGAEDTVVHAFRPADGGPEHLALAINRPDPAQPVLCRIHSSCLTGDVLGSLRCDCGPQLYGAIDRIAHEAGVLLYLQQEGRGIGLVNKMRAYQLQSQGFDTVDANERLGFEADERLFAPAAGMLRALGMTRIRLLTNNPDKVTQMTDLGIEVAERVPHTFPANPHNRHYLDTKKRRSGHYL